MNVSKRPSRPKTGKYTQRNEENGAKVATCFDKYIKSKGTGSKGSLPGVQEVAAFIGQHQIFQDPDMSEKQKISLTKKKIIEEKKYRALV